MNKPAAPNIHPISVLDARFDFDTAKRFIELIRGDANTLMQFRALPKSQEAKRRFESLTSDERTKKRRNYPGRLSELAPRLQRMNKSGHAIFVALNEFDGNGRKKENLVAAHVIPLDLDGGPLPDNWQIQPHWIQETSLGRYQCFFVIDRTTDIAAVEDVARRLASNYGGDPAVFDATHVFRMPGFYHQKGKPFRVKSLLENEFEPTRKLSDFEFLPALPKRDSAMTTVGAGTLDSDKAELLFGDDGALDPTKFGTNDKWIQLAMATHAAYGGDPHVRDLFLEFCKRDPNFSSDKEAEGRWESLGLKKRRLLGVGTLFKICRDHKVDDAILHAVFIGSAADDFEGFDDPDFDSGTISGIADDDDVPSEFSVHCRFGIRACSAEREIYRRLRQRTIPHYVSRRRRRNREWIALGGR